MRCILRRDLGRVKRDPVVRRCRADAQSRRLIYTISAIYATPACQSLHADLLTEQLVVDRLPGE